MGRRKATTENLTTKAAALYLLRRGLMSYADIAKRAGLSRQAIRYWGTELADPDAHEAHLDKLWQRALRHAGR